MKMNVESEMNMHLTLCSAFLTVAVALFLAVPCRAQTVVINEFMASNSNFLFDEDGDDPDWIEIYNDSEYAVNLSCYSLTDDPGDLTKWMFPDTVLAGGAFLLVFASGKDRSVAGCELHTNFKINTDGEDVILGCTGIVQQHIEPVRLNTNESYGAVPDGSGNFFVFTSPTPGMPNKGYHHKDVVVFSQPGGVYPSAFELTLRCLDPKNRMFFTLDGSIPSASSNEYTEPLLLDNSLTSPADIAWIQIAPVERFKEPRAPVRKCILIRAAVFNRNSERISEVETHSYFIKELGVDHYNLPVVSISAEYEDLFDEVTGIMVPGIHWDPTDPFWTGNYFHRGSNWERKIYIEYFEPDNTLGFRQQVGLRIHGGGTRTLQQKSLRLYARSEYGRNTIDHKFFDDRETASFKRLILRSFVSSSSLAGTEDHISSVLSSSMNMEWLASRPVVLYLNGEYWGVYFLHERFDERYLDEYFELPEEGVDIIANWLGDVDQGDAVDYWNLYRFIAENDLSTPSNYETVARWIDIDCFIDYQLLEIFCANEDWPANNMKLWRPRSDDGKWRWTFFDGDATFLNVDFPGFEVAMNTSHDPWPTNARSTLFLRKLLMNEDFAQRFFDRLEYLLNNELTYENTSVVWRSITAEIRNDIQNMYERFSLPHYDYWLHVSNNIHHFLRFRPCAMEEQAYELFDRTILIPPCLPLTIPISDEATPFILDGSVYPNPSNGMFTLALNATIDEKATFCLLDILGRRVLLRDDMIFKGDNSFIFNGRTLSPGMYLIVVQSGEKIFTTRLLMK